MGRIGRVVLGAWLAAGCGGVSEGDFVVEYVDAYCDWFLACGDQAQLTFDGIGTVEVCRSLVGPEVAAQAAACDLDRRAASSCLEAMAEPACPEGGELDEGLPEDCTSAWKDCSGGEGGS